MKMTKFQRLVELVENVFDHELYGKNRPKIIKRIMKRTWLVYKDDMEFKYRIYRLKRKRI